MHEAPSCNDRSKRRPLSSNDDGRQQRSLTATAATKASSDDLSRQRPLATNVRARLSNRDLLCENELLGRTACKKNS